MLLQEPDDRSPRAGAVVARAILALALLAPATRASSSGLASDGGRVIVLGFDGADANTAAAMIERGELPHLARLKKEGTFAPLGTTVPAESPVSWASLNSGQNPAKTGIPGFIKRVLPPGGSPQPSIGFYEPVARETASLDLPPALRFLVRFEPNVAGAICGLAAALLFALLFAVRAPHAPRGRDPARARAGRVRRDRRTARERHGAPADPEHRREPDADRRLLGDGRTGRRPVRRPRRRDDVGPAGGPGARRCSPASASPTSAARTATGSCTRPIPRRRTARPAGRGTSTGGTVFRVDEVKGRIEASVHGPKTFDPGGGNRWRRGAAPHGPARRRAQGEPAREGLPRRIDHEVAEGEWSPWYRIAFSVNALVKVHAITRVKVLRFEEPFTLYLDFLQIDPSAPPFWQPISQPPKFSRELARATATPFETVGWACLTMPLKDKEIDAKTFLEDIDATRAGRERLFAEGRSRSPTGGSSCASRARPTACST
jgi:hypothetical protein